jgi:DNA-binding NarL/FixJ family response regulator
MNVPITVSLVEDERATREALVALIDGTPGFRCLGAHATAEAGLAKLPQERPQVVLVELALPVMSGTECVHRLRSLLPQARILVLTKYEDPVHIFEALKAGAHGYVLKKIPPARLLEAIADVQAGGAPLSSEVSAQVVNYFHAPASPTAELTALTRREREVLELLARGLPYREIEEQLHLSHATLRTHLSHIYEKLHAHNRTEATVKFLQR